MQNDFRPAWDVKPAPKLKPTQLAETKSEPAAPFKTPEQVSLTEQAPVSEPAPHGPYASLPQPPTNGRGTGHHWFNLPWPPSRQEVILVSMVLFMALFGVIGFLNWRSTPPAVVGTVKPVQPAAGAKVEPILSTLSGLPVADAAVNDRPVVGVMIENSKTARPQSGLSEAGVVFEAIAEGGITRFLALFQDQQPGNIGPVRSARPYYVQWNEGFRGAYAHVGGSPDALENIKAWGVQDLNQFYNAGAFRREPSRPSPHNVYSNVASLAALASQKGYKSEYTGFERKKASPSQQPAATNIDLNISSALYNVHYGYDAASNSYLRSEGGEVHTDANTGKQLSPNVVVAMVVPLTPGGKTAQGGAYSNYNVLGSGPAYIFQDGNVTVGNWNKADTRSQITFTDAKGTAVKLNPGQTWMTAISAATKVAYR